MKKKNWLLGTIGGMDAALILIIGLGFAACGGGDDETPVTPPAHTHTYSTTWSSNATQHWKECTGADCDAKTETANHAPSNGKCTTCQYDNTPAHTHTYSTTWSSNAAQHWKECTGAGCDAKTEIANHAQTNGVCTTCGYDNTPPHTHTYSTTWSNNETYHWKECTGAGCDDITESGYHEPADGVCTTCGYDNHTHTYSSEWTSDETEHWKECTGADCDAKTDTANHTLAHGLCTTCGYGTVIHKYSLEWTSDETEHWKECTFTNCDTITETAYHAPADGVCTTCGYDSHVHAYVYTVTSTSYPAQSIQTCSCGETTGTTRDTIIGDTGPAGGIIFYVAASGFKLSGIGPTAHYYLEAAPVNQGTSLTWVSSGYSTTSLGTGEEVGAGRMNTYVILNVNANAPAAKACADYRGGGKNDWFLPSKDELNEMYNARTHLGITSGNYEYWSSSQYNYDYCFAWTQRFVSGYSLDFKYKESNYLYVRAVRAF